MPPLVSIIVPAFNAESYLGDALRSALAQTWPRVEIVVVNDGSRDGTLATARAFEGPRVRVIDQPNRGAAASRNRGLRDAQGEFIQFLDADDILAPGKIAAQMRRLADAPDCVAAGRWGRFYASPADVRFRPEPFWQDLAPVDWLVACWGRASMMHPGAWLVPRPRAEAAGPWDESLSLNDDGEYFARVVLASRRVLHCDSAVAYYRSGLPTSLSGSKSPSAWDSGFRAAAGMVRSLLAAEESPQTRRAGSRVLEEFVYASYPDAPRLRQQAWDRVIELGGPYFRPQMGPRMRVVSRVVGWRMAVRLGRLRSALSRRRPAPGTSHRA